MQATPVNEKRSLRRVLTLPLLTLYGLGVTIGAGIYVLVGATAAKADVFAPMSFVIAAIVVAFTALSYAELATRYPVSAGEAAYVKAGFQSTSLATIVGLLVALSGIVSASAIAIGAGSYLNIMFGLPVPALTIATVLLVTAIACWGIAGSVKIAALVTLVEVAGLLLVIGWGFGSDGQGGASLSELVPQFEGAAWLSIASASLLAFFAFVGFEDMVNVAEEVKKPRETFPTAVVITLVCTTMLYVATTSAVIVSVPMSELAGNPAPLALVFANAPDRLSDAFARIAVIATVNGILIQIIMASRVIYGLANAGHLPRRLAWIAPRTRTPVVATVLVTAAILLLTQTFPIERLAQHTSQIVLVVFVLVNFALLRLGPPAPDEANHFFTIPRIVPMLGLVTSLGLMLTTWI